MLPPPVNFLHASFLICCTTHHLDLHSFPTRRSSDLRLLFLASVTNSHDGESPIRDFHKRCSHFGHTWAMIFALYDDLMSIRLNCNHLDICCAVLRLEQRVE